MVFHGSLSDSKSSQISQNLLSYLLLWEFFKPALANGFSKEF